MPRPRVDALPRWFGEAGLFEGLDDAARAQLLGGLEAVVFDPGELLFEWGDEADEMLYIESGQVSVFRPDGPDGVEVELSRAGPGRVLGELTYLDDGQRSASGRAVSEVHAWRLPFSVLRAVEATHPSAMELYRVLAHQLAHKVRTGDDGVVAGALELSRAAKLLVTVIAIQSGTLIATGLMTQLLRQAASHTSILLGYLVFVSVVGLIYARRIELPLRDFGLTTEGWRPALRDALVATAVVMGLALGLKWAAVTFVSGWSHLPVFDYLDVTRGHGRSDDEQLRILGWSVVGYTFAGASRSCTRAGCCKANCIASSGRARSLRGPRSWSRTSSSRRSTCRGR